MASEAISGNLSEHEIQGAWSSPDPRKTWDLRKFVPPFFRKTDTHALAVAQPMDGSSTPPNSATTTETVLGDRFRITDVFPHQINPEQNPLTRKDIETTLEWAQHPEVAGHIYQLESDTSKLNLSKWEYFLLYYKGAIDDEGNSTDPNESIFYKAVNGSGLSERMLANTRVRMSGVEWVKSPRTAYWERAIVDPELLGKKIGLAFGIDVHFGSFYKYEGYGRNKLPAKEVRATTYADRSAKGWERNEEFLYALGYEHHGDIMIVNGRRIQPWRNTLDSFETKLPDALARISVDQPERAAYLEKEAERLQPILHDRLKDLGY